MSSGITREDVFEAAKEIAAKEVIPTQENIRAYLGSGSKGTIQKYFKEWKQNCFQKSSVNMATTGAGEVQKLLKEKYDLGCIIDTQIEQNEHLSSQLVDAELENARNREKTQQLETEFRLYKEQALKMEGEYKALSQALQAIKEERASAIQLILDDKNQQIDSLKEELKELHQASLVQVRDAGFRGDEAFMQEKVISLNLKEKVLAQEKMLEALQQQLLREQQSILPLRKEIERQRRMIEKLVSFEQLQAYKDAED